MRMALIAFAVLAVLPVGIESAVAQRAPYCLTTAGGGGTGDGLPDCTYHTLQQCLAARGGGGDGCMPSQWVAWDRLEGKRAVPPRSPSRPH